VGIYSYHSCSFVAATGDNGAGMKPAGVKPCSVYTPVPGLIWTALAGQRSFVRARPICVASPRLPLFTRLCAGARAVTPRQQTFSLPDATRRAALKQLFAGSTPLLLCGITSLCALHGGHAGVITVSAGGAHGLRLPAGPHLYVWPLCASIFYLPCCARRAGMPLSSLLLLYGKTSLLPRPEDRAPVDILFQLQCISPRTIALLGADGRALTRGFLLARRLL